MASSEKSQLKRLWDSPQAEESTKKARRSDRLGKTVDDTDKQKTPVTHNRQNLPSPVTNQELTEQESNEQDSADRFKEATATPPTGRPSQVTHRSPEHSPAASPGLVNTSSPLDATQPWEIPPIDPNAPLSHEVNDEVKEGVWGYLYPIDVKYGGPTVVLRKRHTCPVGDTVGGSKPAKVQDQEGPLAQEKSFEAEKAKEAPAGGYLIGRHPECDIVVDEPIISNRHCLLFTENKGNEGLSIAILEDLSSNGTFVNEALVGRNQRMELSECDEIAVNDKVRFIFRYPRAHSSSPFLQQYNLLERLGKGHFAEVYLCVEKTTGKKFAVKIFTKKAGQEDKSKTDGLQQEIAVLMAVSHPNVLCLKDTFNEKKAVYLVLELAPEGELFNVIVEKQKLSENEARQLFIQLFQGIKYLHDRNIVHRDIKPENILVVDKQLHVKLADFGLAKIVGEDSFTTTLCGTPSYVAPEILAEGRHRKYTKAVDIWSLGVVLYICLCGFPPFSDELYSREFPYTLAQQIKAARFDYPAPYWDSVGDPALDLIDRMLVVDPEQRFTVDQCLSHPWVTQKAPDPNDSTGGLVAGIDDLGVVRRGVTRERTLLSSINTVQVVRKVELGPQEPEEGPVKVYKKNAEARPADDRDPGAFMELGDKDDQPLFNNDDASYYSKTDLAAAKAAKGKNKQKA